MYQMHIEAAPFDPEDLHGLRSRIDAETGGRYAAFRRSLTPHYGKVRRDLAIGYAGIATVLAVVGVFGWVALPLAAPLVGLGVAYLQLFIHEGAHFGLSPNRLSNDRIANLLICWQVGTDIASYRATHWEHHRSLGTDMDSEVSYRNRLSLRFVFAMLSGIHAIRVFLQRRAADRSDARIGSARKVRPLIAGIAGHFAIAATLASMGSWAAVLAWVLGVGIFFPAFATVRQLLEHRPAADGTRGAVTRLFGDDRFSRAFGAAGFNRHMLHHMEPQVSYTRLEDLERFLMQTSACAELDARRSSYWNTFTEIVRNDARG